MLCLCLTLYCIAIRRLTVKRKSVSVDTSSSTTSDHSINNNHNNAIKSSKKHKTPLFKNRNKDNNINNTTNTLNITLPPRTPYTMHTIHDDNISTYLPYNVELIAGSRSPADYNKSPSAPGYSKLASSTSNHNISQYAKSPISFPTHHLQSNKKQQLTQPQSQQQHQLQLSHKAKQASIDINDTPFQTIVVEEYRTSHNHDVNSTTNNDNDEKSIEAILGNAVSSSNNTTSNKMQTLVATEYLMISDTHNAKINLSDETITTAPITDTPNVHTRKQQRTSPIETAQHAISTVTHTLVDVMHSTIDAIVRLSPKATDKPFDQQSFDDVQSNIQSFTVPVSIQEHMQHTPAKSSTIQPHIDNVETPAIKQTNQLQVANTVRTTSIMTPSPAHNYLNTHLVPQRTSLSPQRSSKSPYKSPTITIIDDSKSTYTNSPLTSSYKPFSPTSPDNTHKRTSSKLLFDDNSNNNADESDIVKHFLQSPNPIMRQQRTIPVDNVNEIEERNPVQSPFKYPVVNTSNNNSRKSTLKSSIFSDNNHKHNMLNVPDDLAVPYIVVHDNHTEWQYRTSA